MRPACRGIRHRSDRQNLLIGTGSDRDRLTAKEARPVGGLKKKGSNPLLPINSISGSVSYFLNLEGMGELDNAESEIVTFTAAEQPGLTRIKVTATQDQELCEDEGIVTVTDSLLPEMQAPAESQQGLPGYTFSKAPGELWRSKYDVEQNVIVINNGHRDFVYASRNRSLKLRYICRLFAKEMAYRNFPGSSPEQLLERMIELSLARIRLC